MNLYSTQLSASIHSRWMRGLLDGGFDPNAPPEASASILKSYRSRAKLSLPGGSFSEVVIVKCGIKWEVFRLLAANYLLGYSLNCK